MASDMKPDPIPIRLSETQYVRAFTKTSYLLFWHPVMETKYICNSIFLNRYNLQEFNERFEKLLFNGNLHCGVVWQPFS